MTRDKARLRLLRRLDALGICAVLEDTRAAIVVHHCPSEPRRRLDQIPARVGPSGGHAPGAPEADRAPAVGEGGAPGGPGHTLGTERSAGGAANAPRAWIRATEEGPAHE